MEGLVKSEVQLALILHGAPHSLLSSAGSAAGGKPLRPADEGPGPSASSRPTGASQAHGPSKQLQSKSLHPQGPENGTGAPGPQGAGDVPPPPPPKAALRPARNNPLASPSMTISSPTRQLTNLGQFLTIWCLITQKKTQAGAQPDLDIC